MNTELLKVLQEQFLGKRIAVFVEDRDNQGKIIKNKRVQCTGTCTFIGSNPVLEWDLQVTIDGMPVRVQHINDITLAPERTRVKKAQCT